MSIREFNTALRGFHYYKRYWTPKPDEKLTCAHEEENAFDIFVMKYAKRMVLFVGHLPRELSKDNKVFSGQGSEDVGYSDVRSL